MNESMKQTNDRLVQDNVDLKCEAEGKDARIVDLEAERDANIKARSEVIAELKAEVEERDELIGLFETMWANVTEDHVAGPQFHLYSKLMDRWAERSTS